MANKVDQMRAFQAVVETGGFSRATGRIGMSRAAVSRHILDLEDRLGVRLLNRTTRQMSLTEIGSSFYEKCCLILEEIGQAERSASDSSSGPQGMLRIVAPVNFGLSDLGEAVVEFLRAYPLIQLDLSLNDQTVDPMEGGYDIAIRLRMSEPQVPKTLDIARISQSTRILCASPAYLDQHGEPGDPDALTEHQCLSYSYVDDPGTWRLLRGGREYVVPVTSRITTSAGRVIAAAAEQGLGIAYGPEAFFREPLARGTIRRVLTDYELPRASIYSLSARSRYVPAKIDAFNTFMERFFVGRIF
jgi:DNA-binding transcriptional LysR family regulator